MTYFENSKFKTKGKWRGHPGLNRGPLDLQSNALPLSYTPTAVAKGNKNDIRFSGI